MKTETCRIKGCGRPTVARELCGSHFRRRSRNIAAGRAPEDGLSEPFRDDRGPTTGPFGSRVSRAAAKALESIGGLYSGAVSLIELWAAGEPLPKRPRRRRAA